MAGGHVTKGHPNVWAFLTLIAFPIVLLSTDVLGASGIWPFLFAMGSTLLILALEAIVRGKIWPFEPGYAEYLGHPDLPMRLVIFMAACLFLLQTAFFVAVSVDPHFDESIMAFILQRQCTQPGASSLSLCASATKSTNPTLVSSSLADPIGYAIRTQAAKLWFPGDLLATCSERIVTIAPVVNGGQRVVAIVECANWTLSEDGVVRKKTSVTRFVGAQLTKDVSGFLRITAWTDDYTSANWDSVLGSIAESSRVTAQTLSVYPEFSTVLEAESLGRAQAIVGR